ncbi:MAG TPA: cysteine desulfurase [Propionibacteriaceae bacterium]|nr:cysteine desulfurase [Propionibacteriaceae bacterium]
MTVVPSADGLHSEASDETFVARLANDIFRQGPELGAFAADRAEEVDAVPGHGANAATDLGAKSAGLAYRDDPAVTRSIPADALPPALPGSLGIAASSPSSFLLRSAPLGVAMPAEVAQPWRQADAHRWQAPDFRGRVVEVPYTTGPMVSDAPGVGALRQLASTRLDASTPPGPPAAPVPGTGASRADGSRLYFLGASAPAGERGRDGRMPLTGYDAELVRRDFPVLHQRVHGRRLVWLDNAATTQKPQCVIDEMARFYQHDNSNIHRGAHELAARATDAYEGARARVAALIGAASTHEIVFVRGTTEAINLVAQSYGRSVVGPGDEIVLTTLEHHSNIVPWQLLAKEKGASLRPVRIDDRGDVMLDHYASLLGPRTRIVALSQVSNALGTIVPVSAMAGMAKAVGATVVVDGAQGVPHLPVDVQSLGADFYAFSGHKMYGPTGIGALWGREVLLDAMPPWQGGGSMIKRVDFESSTWNDLPYKFEAGTGSIADAVGLGRAIDYVMALGLPQIAAHEQALLGHGTAALAAIPGLRLIGTSLHKAGVLSFVLDGTQVEAVGRFLDEEGIAVRAGHHCAQPALRQFGLDATVRPSIGIYNTHDDIDVLAGAVRKAANALRR